jgi:bacterioferritin (cytochrome b1)
MVKYQIIQLLNNDLKNEWKHMNFYLYYASAVQGLFHEEYKELFLEEAASEMKHVTEFSDLIYGLGATPSFSPNPFDANVCGGGLMYPNEILQYAIKMEMEVLQNYVQRIKDVEEWQETEGAIVAVDAKWIEIFLEDQIQHSRQDVDKFRRMLA